MYCFPYNSLEGESQNKAEVVQKTRTMEIISPGSLSIWVTHVQLSAEDGNYYTHHLEEHTNKSTLLTQQNWCVSPAPPLLLPIR